MFVAPKPRKQHGEKLMEKKLALRKCTSDTVGVSATSQGIRICAELYGRESNGILLYEQGKEEPLRIDFAEEMRFGNIYRCVLTGISPQDYFYLFHEDGEAVTDIFAKRLVGHRLFGEAHRKAAETDTLKACAFVPEKYDWRGDKRPKTAYEDSVYYGMHVRGFTKDASSRIREAGTFAGVQKKIPYLKKMGVTGIVLQPIYEFEECMKTPESRNISEVSSGQEPDKGVRLNYWGYLPGYYMAPKNAYSYSEDAVTELKTLVYQLHKSGLEIILQFYFEPSVTALRIRDILLYWAKNYHIDGFELLGAELPLKEIVLEPELSDLKLWSDSFPYEEIARLRAERKFPWIPEGKTGGKPKKSEKSAEIFFAGTDMGYQNTVRQFLKGDGGILPAFLQRQRNRPEDHAQINFLAAYHGFRLADVVSYEHKHNEGNGEDNRDGEDINYSWNCGVEGETKKKSVLALRQKLMKNALTMLFTAQGTPFLFMGDEWGKSGGGNNNPYCQDNGLTWQKWNLKKPEKELLAFTAQLIALRKAHGILHQSNPLTLMDHLSCGFPDLSYHGEEAWRTNMNYQTRHIGVMLCGKYCVTDGKEDDCLYIAYNMHWEPQNFALPKPFRNTRWRMLLHTAQTVENNVPDAAQKTSDVETVTLPGRSACVYVSEKIPEISKKHAGKSRRS